MPAAFFTVRSTVADPAKRAAFDKWYQDDFWPDVLKSLRVKKAWRLWSLTDPAVHQATYQFDDEAVVDRAMKEEVSRLIDIFVRDWPTCRASARPSWSRRNLVAFERTVDHLGRASQRAPPMHPFDVAASMRARPPARVPANPGNPVLGTLLGHPI